MQTGAVLAVQPITYKIALTPEFVAKHYSHVKYFPHSLSVKLRFAQYNAEVPIPDVALIKEDTAVDSSNGPVVQTTFYLWFEHTHLPQALVQEEAQRAFIENGSLVVPTFTSPADVGAQDHLQAVTYPMPAAPELPGGPAEVQHADPDQMAGGLLPAMSPVNTGFSRNSFRLPAPFFKKHFGHVAQFPHEVNVELILNGYRFPEVRNGKITERWRDKKWNMKIQFLTHGYNKELSKFNLFAIKELQCPEPDLVRVHILASKDMAGDMDGEYDEKPSRRRISHTAAGGGQPEGSAPGMEGLTQDGVPSGQPGAGDLLMDSASRKRSHTKMEGAVGEDATDMEALEAAASNAPGWIAPTSAFVLKSIPNDHLNRKKMRLPTGFYTQHFAHVEAWPHPVRVQLQLNGYEFEGMFKGKISKKEYRGSRNMFLEHGCMHILNAYNLFGIVEIKCIEADTIKIHLVAAMDSSITRQNSNVRPPQVKKRMTWAELVNQPRPEVLASAAAVDGLGAGDLGDEHHHHHGHHHHREGMTGHETHQELVQLQLQQQQHLLAALQQQQNMGFAGLGDMVHPELQVQPLTIPASVAMQAARLQQEMAAQAAGGQMGERVYTMVPGADGTMQLTTAEGEAAAAQAAAAAAAAVAAAGGDAQAQAEAAAQAQAQASQAHAQQLVAAAQGEGVEGQDEAQRAALMAQLRQQGIILRSAREDGGDDTTAAEQEVAEILQHQFAGAGANLAALPPGFAAAAAANGGVQYAGGYVPHYLVFSYPIDAAQGTSQPTTVLPLSLETAAAQQQVQQLQAAAAQQQAAQAQAQAAHQAQQAAQAQQQAQQQQQEASPDHGQHGPSGQQQGVVEPRQKKRKAGEEDGEDEDTA